MRRRMLGALVSVVLAALLLGLRAPAPVSAYYVIPCQSNGDACPWRNPDIIYVGAYGDGIPGYLMQDIAAATQGWNSATAFTLAWENRSDYNADIIVVPYWQNAGSRNSGNAWTMLGGCDRYSGDWCTHGEIDINLDPDFCCSDTNRSSDAWLRPVQTMTLEQEFGHVLGLDHSCAQGIQIMSGPNYWHNCGAYPSCGGDGQPSCPTSPQNDDIAGISALYPNGGDEGGASSGCAGTAPPSPPDTLPALPAPSPLPTAAPTGLPTPLPTEVVPQVQPEFAPPTLPPTLPPRPTLPPGVSTSPGQYWFWQNGIAVVQQEEAAPLQLPFAAANNERAKAQGIAAGGQRIHVPGGPVTPPDVYAPSTSRPC